MTNKVNKHVCSIHSMRDMRIIAVTQTHTGSGDMVSLPSSLPGALLQHKNIDNTHFLIYLIAFKLSILYLLALCSLITQKKTEINNQVGTE